MTLKSPFRGSCHYVFIFYFIFLFSPYFSIFCVILNNLSCFVTSHADAQMAVAHLMASSFTLYKNRPILNLIVRLLVERNMFCFEIMKILLQLAKLKFPALYLSCVNKCLFSSHFEHLIKIERFSQIYDYFCLYLFVCTLVYHATVAPWVATIYLM